MFRFNPIIARGQLQFTLVDLLCQKKTSMRTRCNAAADRLRKRPALNDCRMWRRLNGTAGAGLLPSSHLVAARNHTGLVPQWSHMISAMRSVWILGRHWKLTAIAVFSLSIAMALGILSLSISNTTLLLPLAAPEADRLVMIYARAPAEAIGGISYPDYEYYRRNNNVFSDIAAVPNSIGINASFNPDKHEEVRVVTRPVSDRYFAVLGIRPYLGRLFTPGDDDSKSAIAVMTYFCWRRLGADPQIVGKQVTGRTIVGVAPPTFTGSFYGVEGDLFTR